MSYSFGFAAFLPWLLMLPVLIGQWIGILGLGKGKRRGDWWCMMTGVSLSTLGNILTVAITLSPIFRSPVGANASWMMAYVAIGACSGLGSLLFAGGFAVHGQRGAKDTERIIELETIAQAQAEELARLQAG